MFASTQNSGQQMPGGFPAADDPDSPATPAVDGRSALPPRRSSFNFLRRGKSVERMSSPRSISGAKLSKKQMKERSTSREPEVPAIPQQPPEIPKMATPPRLQTFGGDGARPDSIAMSNRNGGYHLGPSIARRFMEARGHNTYHDVPIPPIPDNDLKPKGGHEDPYARTESMTNRGRYSYASSAVSTINSPRRVRRRKDPTPFNVLIVGARNSGKTSFLEFLRSSLTLPKSKQRPPPRDDYTNHSEPFAAGVNPNFKSQYLETEIEGERIGLTLWDSEGLEKSMVDLQLRDMTTFLESKFEDTFSEEMKVVRSPGVQDTHIHCVFLMLDPLRLDMNVTLARKVEDANKKIVNGNSFYSPTTPTAPSPLDEGLDLQVLRALQGKTTVVPVISKADTITSAHMAELKRVVWDTLKKANLDPLEALGLDDAEGDGDGDGDSLREGDEENTIPQSIKIDKTRASKHNRQLSTTSHLESASSSSSSGSPARPETNGKPHPSHTRTPSLTVPSAPTPFDSPTTTPYLPLSTISPDPSTPHITGRAFPWGFADPYNEAHCDFLRLKEAVFKEWRGELREASRELWYERWRTGRLGGGRGNGVGRGKVNLEGWGERGEGPMSVVVGRGR